MTFPQDETTKVRLASVSPVSDGGYTLKVSTVNKVELEFHLDDMATAFLAFTTGVAAREITAKTDVDKNNVFIFPKEEEVK